MNKLIVIGVLGLMLVGVIGYNYYKIPQLIPEDYNCEDHPGFISKSKLFMFESEQHYINRKNKAVQKQLEDVCR